MAMINKIVLSLFIVFLTAAFQAQDHDIGSLAEEAKNKFNSVLTDSSNLEFAISDKTKITKKIFKKGKKLRIECVTVNRDEYAKKEDVSNVLLYDGETGSIVSLNNGVPSKMKGDYYQKDVRGAFYQVFRNWWDLDTANAEMTKSENVGNVDCYVIYYNRPGWFVDNYKIWVDKKTLLLVKDEIKHTIVITKVFGATDNKPRPPLEIDDIRKFSDYRKITENWQMPYSVEYYSSGKLYNHENIKSLKLNADISDELFKELVVQISGTGQAKIASGTVTNIAKTADMEGLKPSSAVNLKEEDIVLKYMIFPAVNGINVIPKKETLYSKCKNNENEFTIIFKEPIYISKMIFKRNQSINEDVGLPESVYRGIGIQVSYLNEKNFDKILATFNPVGKKYYDITIRDMVTEIKVKNTHPEYIYKAPMNEALTFFNRMFYDLNNIELTCIKGKNTGEIKSK